MKMLLYPFCPKNKYSMVERIVDDLGIEVVEDPTAEFDVAFNWLYKTTSEIDPVLERISRETPVINLRCTDISKVRVEEAFIRCFGYSSLVDPRVYEGLCFEKPNANAEPDHCLLRAPIPASEIRPEFVYQIYCGEGNDECMTELRVPVVYGFIPDVRVKILGLPNLGLQFDKSYKNLIKDEQALPNEVFSNEELRQVSDFCRELKMDYGELDEASP